MGRKLTSKGLCGLEFLHLRSDFNFVGVEIGPSCAAATTSNVNFHSSEIELASDLQVAPLLSDLNLTISLNGDELRLVTAGVIQEIVDKLSVVVFRFQGKSRLCLPISKEDEIEQHYKECKKEGKNKNGEEECGFIGKNVP
ncbi:hypothetical protein SLA2020_223960 [Shorea laevis]